MSAVPVFYATTDGHTRRIAERIVGRLRHAGVDAEAIDLTTDAAAQVDWSACQGAVVAAPQRWARHHRAARAFVRAHQRTLSSLPSIFISVSLGAVSPDPDERESALDDAKRFVVQTGWTPTSLATIAGALTYTRYNPLMRWFMRRIAEREGGPTDTTRDHVLTDWSTVDQLADDLAEQIASGMRRDLRRGA